ncbi:MAG: GIY-YIG nuclease family protein [bacterium]|nr:GIY-YIG nuclease family protein [bacterium]
MHPLPGTYTLILASSFEKPINIGKLGTLLLKPGFYAYIGSAFGPGGLKARIRHHRKFSNRPHWHLDYLGSTLRLCEVWYTHDQTRREHQWAEVHAQTRGVILPQPGFGSSDCHCRSHLFFYKSKPSGRHFRRKIRAKFKDHARFMIEKS